MLSSIFFLNQLILHLSHCKDRKMKISILNKNAQAIIPWTDELLVMNSQTLTHLTF